MKKQQFFKEIKEILLLNEQDVHEETGIEIDSMSSLLLIAFFDENFSKTLSEEKIKIIKKVGDLVEIVGKDNLD